LDRVLGEKTLASELLGVPVLGVIAPLVSCVPALEFDQADPFAVLGREALEGDEAGTPKRTATGCSAGARP